MWRIHVFYKFIKFLNHKISEQTLNTKIIIYNFCVKIIDIYNKDYNLPEEMIGNKSKLEMESKIKNSIYR